MREFKENLDLSVDLDDLARQLLKKGLLTTLIARALLRDPVEGKAQIYLGISEAARETKDECIQHLSLVTHIDEINCNYKLELENIATLIEAVKYNAAQIAVDKLRVIAGEFPELVRLQTKIDRITLLAK